MSSLPHLDVWFCKQCNWKNPIEYTSCDVCGYSIDDKAKELTNNEKNSNTSIIEDTADYNITCTYPLTTTQLTQKTQKTYSKLCESYWLDWQRTGINISKDEIEYAIQNVSNPNDKDEVAIFITNKVKQKTTQILTKQVQEANWKVIAADKNTKDYSKLCLYCNTHAIICTIVLIGAIIGLSFGVYIGNRKILEADEYAKSVTKQQCKIISYDIIECSYRCGCNGKSCSTCYSNGYKYTAIQPTMCGNIELYSVDIGNEECPQTLKIINQNYTCYIIKDCENEFSFDNPSKVKSDANSEFLACAILLGLSPLCCCLCLFGLRN